MDSHTKRRLVWSFLSASVARLAQTAIQFVQVPVFLHFWSVSTYGEWLILYSIPTYLWFSNAGFGNVAGNDMTMLVAGGDRPAAMRVFQSCWWLIIFVCGLFTGLFAIALWHLPVARLLRIHTISEHDTRWILFWLALSILLAALEQLLQSAYRSIGRYPYGTFVKSMMAIVAFACTLVPVMMRKGPLATAEVFAAASIGSTLFLAALVKHDIPWMEYGWRYARFAEVRRLFRPSVAFMAFPVGQSLNLSGPQFALQYALGPYAVVVFTTARTVSRGALQMVQMVNSTFEPEMTLAYGAKDIPLTRSLHRRACQLALIVALAVVAGVMTIGPYFLHAWTGGHVPPSRGLLTVLLAGVVIYSLWATSSSLITATNQHQRLAVVYLLATAITCVACFAGAWLFGLYGAAATLLLADVAMSLYVLPASLRIAQDTLPAFLTSMRHYPESLKPAALLARVRRRPIGTVSPDLGDPV